MPYTCVDHSVKLLRAVSTAYHTGF